jgi:hypothetical protein
VSKRKIDFGNVRKEAWTLIKGHRRSLTIGFTLMFIGRLAGFVLPATSKYVIDTVLGQNRMDLLFPLAAAATLATLILAAPVSGHPISFAVDGKQYIAVSTGGNTHPEKTALSLHPEIKVTQGYNSMFVFRLRAGPADRSKGDQNSGAKGATGKP